MVPFRSMAAIKLPAAGRLKLIAVPGQGDDMLPEPQNTREAVKAALEAIYLAAKALALAADLADEEETIAPYVMAAESLKNIAHSLFPDGNAWPKDGCAIYDIKTGKQRVN